MLSCRPKWRLYTLIVPYIGSQTALGSFASRTFSTFCPARHKASNHLPPRPTLPDDEIKETYVKGTGPGGQKINKTTSAAQLTHIPTGIVVKCQATRSKSQNYTIARRLLAAKVELLEKGDESRAAKVMERKSTKKRSADKKKRRKYRLLAQEKDGQEGDNDVADEGANDDDDPKRKEAAADEPVEGKTSCRRRSEKEEQI
jgi:peptide chain release factor